MFFLVGVVAQLVDGTLGMGYGVTSSTLLLSLGLYPVMVSASVHTAEVATSFISGLAHWRMGNVRRGLWLPLALSGTVGGVLGALGVVTIPVALVTIAVSLVLFSMGAVMVYRFITRNGHAVNGLYRTVNSYSRYKLYALGFFAAFIDALGGGGWGPICTPSLIITGSEPGKVVGSVNLAEFFVTVAITLTFIILVGPEQFRWDIVLLLMGAGFISAPLAAWLCTRLPHRVLGILVGLLIMLLSVRSFYHAFV